VKSVNYEAHTRFEVFTVVKIQVEFFWIVTPCSYVVGYRRFGGPCCLLQDEWNVGIPPQGVTTQKISTWIYEAPHYVILPLLLLLPFSLSLSLSPIHIILSAPCSQKQFISILLMLWKAKFLVIF